MKTLRQLLALALALGLALPAGAIPLSQWSKTAASNNATVPDGAPENWTGSQVNDWGRQTMKVVRDWYDDPEWLEVTYDLATRGAKTLTRIDADTIDIDLADATAYFTAGRRIQIVGASTVSCFVVSSSLNAGDTRVEVGTSCTVPTSPTAIYAYIGQDLRSAAFTEEGKTLAGLQIMRGEFQGRISYTSASQVTIGRGYNQKLRLEIDGVTVESSSDLTVDISTADREDTASCSGSASEQASTWYYLYIDEVSAVPVEHISSTAPVMDPASGKVGYHPGTCNGSTGWRAVGAVWNNASSNIEPFDYDGRIWTFRSIVSAFTTSPGTGAQTTYTTASLSGKVPATARLVRLQVEIGADDHVYWYGHESVTGTASSSPTPNKVTTRVNSTNNDAYDATQFDLAIDSTPSFAWGNADEGSGGSRSLHRVDVVGWADDLGIVH